MYKKVQLYTIILILLTLLMTGCAWENIPAGGEVKDLRLRINMRVEGTIDPNIFYFIVLNFSGDPKKMPLPEFEGDDRGKNWQAYYMYGNPRLTGHDFYRGIAGKTQSGIPKLDLRPVPSSEIREFVPTSIPTPGNPPSGQVIQLELDFGQVDRTKLKPINLNMMTSSLPFDRVDNPDDQFDAFIYDNFLDNGVTLNLSGSKTDFNEEEYQKEQQENVGEDPPPNANIVFWRVLIL